MGFSLSWKLETDISLTKILSTKKQIDNKNATSRGQQPETIKPKSKNTKRSKAKAQQVYQIVKRLAEHVRLQQGTVGRFNLQIQQ